MALAQLRRLQVVTLIWTALLGVVPGRAAAQELYGSVVGTVQDNSGGRIPGASISITNRETNLVLTTVSNETGAYTFTNVLSGTYNVKVTLQGFKEFVQQRVPVTTGSISRVDAKLEVGQLSESVTVQSEVALLKTDKADTGSVFGAKEVGDLPLSEFRNYQSLLDLVPGSTPSEFQNAEIDTPARALATTVNGTNPNTNSTRVDGATNQFTWLPHHTLYVAPAETIATVNVSTGSFSANQGLAGGAAVTVVTKSGTNQLRGSVFGFYTDQNLRAQTFFARRNGTPESDQSPHRRRHARRADRQEQAVLFRHIRSSRGRASTSPRFPVRRRWTSNTTWSRSPMTFWMSRPSSRGSDRLARAARISRAARVPADSA